MFFFAFLLQFVAKGSQQTHPAMSHQSIQNIILMGKKKREIISIIVGVNGCK